jgi:Protein of unknown function (DUF3099)
VGRRTRIYVVMMTACLLLIALAWNVVRLFSVPAAIVMSIVAAILLPAAVILANAGHDG